VWAFYTKRCKLNCSNLTNGTKSYFSHNEENVGEEALKELEEMLKRGEQPPNVTEEDLKDLEDDVLLVKAPSDLMRENLDYSHPENTRYWPYYFYSYPYNYKDGGAWPPGMFSRLYFWSPGFYTGTGWSYYMRPGVNFNPAGWPRHRWIRNARGGKNTYYYVTNRDDYLHSASDYSNTPLSFHS